jgi:Na+/H+-dicarboxylate symporter
MLASSYPLLNLMWTMLAFFLWILWFWLLITVLIDVFHRRDISGFAKAAWTFFLIVLPFIGVFAYLIGQGESMAERTAEKAQTSAFSAPPGNEARAASNVADQLATGKRLLDEGAIDAAEFDRLKAKVLAT